MSARTAGWLAAVMLLVGCAAPSPDLPAYSAPTRTPFLKAATRAATQPAALPEDPSLADYLQYAGENSPELKAAYHRWRAALEGVPQAKALPDPQLTFAYDIREVQQQGSFEVMQTFPAPGKLSLKGDAAVLAAQTAFFEYQDQRLRLSSRVKEAYYEYYYLARAIAVTRENVRLLEGLESVVRAKYESGGATQADLLRLQVEQGKLSDELRSLDDLRQPTMAALATTLNLSANRELPPPRDLEAPRSLPADTDLTAWAEEYSPKLRGMKAEIERAGKQVELARRDYIPDTTLGFEYMNMPEMPDTAGEALIVSLSINLPIWYDKLAAGVREARQRRMAAVMDRQTERNRLGNDVKSAAYRSRDAQRKVELYRRVLIPKAEESLKATEASFRAGAAAFSDLIDAQRVLLDFRLTLERSQADQLQRQANLEMLLGRSLPGAVAATQPATMPAE